MTTIASDASAPTDESSSTSPVQENPGHKKAIRAVLEKLFELYPQLFGAEFLPLKLGVFRELMEKHPDQFERSSLKAALGLHTRSTRYLQSVAARKKRYDLQGQVVEDVAPEHVFQSLVELYRRRQGHAKEDLAPKLRTQMIAAFEASGLSRPDYVALVHSKDEAINALLEQALQERDEKLARHAALRQAFQGSGKSVKEFAAMYGLNPREIASVLKSAL